MPKREYRMADWSYTDPVLCLAYDTKRKLWHPLIFALLPSERAKGYLNGRAWEYRGYYRNGFDDRLQAVAHAMAEMGPLMAKYHTTGTLTYRLDDVFEFENPNAFERLVWCFPEITQENIISSAPGAPGVT